MSHSYLLPMALMLILQAEGLSADRLMPLDETIVLIRHGEKPQPALGQLSCKGLNRALALPLTLKRYGRPTAIFAPSPAYRIHDGDTSSDSPTYSYLRPLTTIEPYAIQLGMPVNAQIGYNQISRLETELLRPSFAHAYVLVVWEHLQSVLFARHLLATFGGNPSSIPAWPDSDYDTIYVFHLSEYQNGKKHLAFRVDREGLTDSLPDTCPTQSRLVP